MSSIEQHQHEEDDDEVMVGFRGAPCFVNKTLGRLHDFYLVGPIREPEHYVQWFDIIRNARENDVIFIHINSPGGNAFTALQIIRAMNDSQATIIASVEGMCMSAATMIFLTATRCEVSAHGLFMFHNYSGMTIGKGGEMFDQISAGKNWSTKLLHDVYRDFLSVDEINRILEGKDLYMDSEEVIERLRAKFEAMNAREKAKKAEAEAASTETVTPPAMVPPSEPSEPAVTLRPKTKRKKKSGTPGVQESPVGGEGIQSRGTTRLGSRNRRVR